MRRIVRRAVRGAGSALARRLLPAGTRNSLRLALALEDRDRPPRVIDAFDEARVLVLAPHMDDEVAGVGGTLCRHVAAGAHVTVVFTTDGARGCGHLAGRDAEFPTDAQRQARYCTRVRKEESRRACAVLGVSDLVFLDGPDGALTPTDHLVAALRDIVSQRAPQIIYHPSVFDLHEDHWQTNLLLAESLKGTPGAAGIALRGYEVWTPLMANALSDVSCAMASKRAAFEQFASQNSAVDYPRAFDGLNAYRSIHAGRGRGFAEAFQETRIDIFERLLATAVGRS